MEEHKNTIENINLSEKDRTVKILRVAAGWDLKEYDGENIDVDLSCFVLDKNGQTREDGDFVFYNNLKSADLSVRHLGDNRDGMGEKDDEAIIIDISALSYDIYKIVFVVSIYLADERNQDFTHVENSFVRVVNEETDEELARDDMTDRFEDTTAVKFCEIERIGSEWHFRQIHEPLPGGLKQAAESYGCLIASIG
jgi:tellurium resistance protein TerD